jgi:hypothetical protein
MMHSSNSFRLVLLVAAAFSAVTWSQDDTPPVDLGKAGKYVILSKTGISTVPDSVITGDIAVSPAAATYMTGFSLTLEPAAGFSESSQVTGFAYAADYAKPVPKDLTTAVHNMKTAYTDAAGRPSVDAAKVNLEKGNLGGQVLVPGVYTFQTGVKIKGNMTFSGDGVFIIRMTGNLKLAKKTNIVLADNAKAENIFWQVAGFVRVGKKANMKGILLVKTSVLFKTHSTLEGRVLTQTRCDLQKATITQPV